MTTPCPSKRARSTRPMYRTNGPGPVRTSSELSSAFHAERSAGRGRGAAFPAGHLLDQRDPAALAELPAAGAGAAGGTAQHGRLGHVQGADLVLLVRPLAQ